MDTIPPALIEQALNLAECGRLTGYWDHWFHVLLPEGRAKLIFQVKPRGIQVRLEKIVYVTASRRVEHRAVVLAQSYLEHGSRHWDRAAGILEGAPELAPGVTDTTGD